MKVSGLTLATTISAVTTTILMLWNLNKRIKGIDISKIFINFIKVIVASGIMGVVIFIINRLCNYTFASPMKASLVSILASLVIGTIVYAVSLYMVRIREYLNLVALIKSRIFNR